MASSPTRVRRSGDFRSASASSNQQAVPRPRLRRRRRRSRRRPARSSDPPSTRRDVRDVDRRVLGASRPARRRRTTAPRARSVIQVGGMSSISPASRRRSASAGRIHWCRGSRRRRCARHPRARVRRRTRWRSAAGPLPRAASSARTTRGPPGRPSSPASSFASRAAALRAAASTLRRRRSASRRRG